MLRRLQQSTILIVCLALLSPAAIPAAGAPSTQQPIVDQALLFLQLLDQKRIDTAWEITTLYFRQQVDLPTWQQTIQKQRSLLGQLNDRKLAGYRYHSTFEQAPSGLFLQVRFLSDFENNPTVRETVEMFQDFDGRWRVIGYRLEPGS